MGIVNDEVDLNECEDVTYTSKQTQQIYTKMANLKLRIDQRTISKNKRILNLIVFYDADIFCGGDVAYLYSVMQRFSAVVMLPICIQ